VTYGFHDGKTNRRHTSDDELSLRVPRRRKMQPSIADDSILRLGRSTSLFLRAVVWSLKTKLEWMLELDGHNKVSSRPRLHAKNHSASTELYAVVGQVGNPNRHVYRGAFRNLQCAGKQDAPETDVFRSGLCYLIRQFESDWHIQGMANIPPYLLKRGVDEGHGCRKDYADATMTDR